MKWENRHFRVRKLQHLYIFQNNTRDIGIITLHSFQSSAQCHQNGGEKDVIDVARNIADVLANEE